MTIAKDFRFWDMRYGDELKQEILETRLSIYQECFVSVLFDKFEIYHILNNHESNLTFRSFCLQEHYINDTKNDLKSYLCSNDV